MNPAESLKHTKWECKYHVVWIPKYRKKRLYTELRRHLGELLKDLAAQKECKILEGHLVSDHVHILIAIPPKYSVSQVVGFIKGKSAIAIARNVWGVGKTSQGKVFGRGATMFQRSAKMRKPSVSTSSIRKKRTGGLSN
jgi:putative transposase